MEERFIDLEMRISHQEDMIDELNKTVYQQQNRIDQLEAALSVLAQRLAERANNGTILTHEKPPHY
ncbi:SlyX family protein [Oxalobacter sp. OttesenSCG-928-P03]|nr:SlyX family protein [Oxalobacter sp. OttesenSCG-928-P03]